MIQARGLTKRFGDRLALCGVDLDAGPGDILGLIGPNGAGKTTTIQILATLMRPDAGVATVAGLDVVSEVAALRGSLGYMPELFGLYDELTVEQYLDFFARVYGFVGKARRQQIDGVIDLVDLSEKRKDRCEGLSKGVRQRLFLARTLLHDPPVLLLDEPASGLDPQARIDLRSLLSLLKGQDKTILVSSHILTELERICTRVVVLEAGQVRFAGSIEDATRQITADHRIRIRLLDPEGVRKAKALLDDHPEVSDLRVEETDLVLRLGVPREDVPAFHRKLVEAKIDVFSFEVLAPDLETLFLDVTRGHVS
jgi:ABC-2 type transport system ATP-binding protein